MLGFWNLMLTLNMDSKMVYVCLALLGDLSNRTSFLIF